MKRINNVYSVVLKILATVPDTRNDDRLLTILVFRNFGIDTRRSFEDAIVSKNAPNIESIRRSRQKAQSIHPELRSVKAVEQERTKNAQTMKLWAVSGGE